MKYYVNTDDEGYVLLIKRTGTVRDFVEMDLSDPYYDFDNDRMFAYKLEDYDLNGVTYPLRFYQARYDKILAGKQAEADQEEIATLKEYLNETDYIMSKWAERIMNIDPNVDFVNAVHAINLEFTTEYGTEIQARIDARERIEELESEVS